MQKHQRKLSSQRFQDCFKRRKDTEICYIVNKLFE